MIPIKPQNTNMMWYTDKVINITSNLKNGKKNRNKDDFDKCINYLKEVIFDDEEIKVSDLAEFLILDYDKLVKVKHILTCKHDYYEENRGVKEFFKVFPRIYNNFYQNNINNDIINKTNVIVCPYCNRNFINSPNDDSVSAELDHFWDKDRNAIFALCFYNLIPVCPTCNRIKRNKAIIRSPYDKERTKDVKFSFIINNADYLHNENGIDIKVSDITYIDDEDGKSDADKLYISDAYGGHKDYVQELLKKFIIYSDDRVNELLKEYSDLYANESELYRLLYGNYVNEDENGKRPLSKLTADILLELEILFQD